MATQYTLASCNGGDGSPARIARELIPINHQHLDGAEILYMFRSPSWERKGRVVGGTAELASAKFRAVAGSDVDFVLTINAELWEGLPDPKRRALIDHKLCHCQGSREEGFSIRGHDVEEFADIIRRHGMWHEGLERFVSEVRQLDLFDPETGEIMSGSAQHRV